MSRDNEEVVRQRISVRAKSRRTVEERLGLRWPGAYARLVRVMAVMPPRSRLRQMIVRRAVRQAQEAYNRRDVTAFALRYHPQVEVITNPKLVALGLEPVYRGREGVRRYYEGFNEVWGEFQGRPQNVIDLDDRLLLLGHMEARGMTSGVLVLSDYALLETLSAGQVIREQFFRPRRGPRSRGAAEP